MAEGSDLGDGHRAARSLAREFAEGEIAPFAAEWAAAHTIPVDVYRRMGEVGLMGLLVPEELGGAGLDQTALCLVVEEIAKADAGASGPVAVQNGLVAAPILAHGTEAQRRRWLPPLAEAAVFGAYALSEPGAGSDAAALRTHAERGADGDFRISGAKLWITNGGFAGLFIVFARTAGPGARGISALLTESGPGLTVSREIAKLGHHTSSTVELAFDEHRAPGAGVLGEEGAGFRIALETLDHGRITIAAQACGIAAAALEVARAHAVTRVAFGGPIARLQGVQFPLADIAARLDAARLLTYHAAATSDAGEPCGTIGAKAKLFASRLAVEAADVAVQTLGGAGYSAEHPAERLYRDAKITEIYEGTSEIQRLVIARDLLGDAARG